VTSTQVTKKSVPGTVVAAECCYGAQLYDPSLRGIPDPICIAYLTAGALGFLGSTNFAYGPETWNGQADLLTQFFFENVVAGASLGRSLLQARQRFISTQDMTDPTNVKTLAQFKGIRDRLRAIAEQKGFSGSKMEVFTVKGPANYRKAVKALGDADEHVVVMSRTIEAPSEIVAIRHLVAHIVGDGITKVSETVSR
jgi:hypothetical protein